MTLYNVIASPSPFLFPPFIPSGPFPALEAVVRGVTPEKLLKFYIAAGEFYRILR